jgi:hypothetical protein
MFPLDEIEFVLQTVAPCKVQVRTPQDVGVDGLGQY